jgi:hypothetical protein
MVFPLSFSQKRSILFLADNELIIYKSASKKISYVQSIPWEEQGFVQTVVQILMKQLGGQPVLIINDMSDVQFKSNQTVAKVSVMDQEKVLSRKLEMTFPSYTIRGAVKVKAQKDKINLDEKINKNNFLFAAVPSSHQIKKISQIIESSSISIVGIVVLPIESSLSLANLVGSKVQAKSKVSTKDDWTIFVGQQSQGSIRQVVVRDGSLAMTRVTPVTEYMLDKDAWVDDVVQDIGTTIGYLSRFGYNPNYSKTNIVVVSDSEACKSIQDSLKVECAFYSYSLSEALERLKLKINPKTLPDSQLYSAQILYAALINDKIKYEMPLYIPEVQGIIEARKVFPVLVMILSILSFFAFGYLGALGYNLFCVKRDIKNQENALAEATKVHDETHKKLLSLGVNVDYVRSSLIAYKFIYENNNQFTPLLGIMSKSLPEDLYINKLDYNSKIDFLPISSLPLTSLGDTFALYEQNKIVKSAKPFDLTLAVKFPKDVDLRLARVQMDFIKKTLGTSLPDYDILITKSLMGLDQSAVVSGGGASPEAGSNEKLLEIQIKGKQKNVQYQTSG